MITDEIIKTRFITEILTADLDRIKSDQLSRLHGVPDHARRHFDIPDITAALQTQTRTLTTTSTTVTVTEQIDRRIRYLDMRRLGNHRIYNKVLFPLLYRSARPRIQYSFTEAVRRRIRESLTDAFAPLNSKQ
jgi:hypothetical protein